MYSSLGCPTGICLFVQKCFHQFCRWEESSECTWRYSTYEVWMWSFWNFYTCMLTACWEGSPSKYSPWATVHLVEQCCHCWKHFWNSCCRIAFSAVINICMDMMQPDDMALAWFPPITDTTGCVHCVATLLWDVFSSVADFMLRGMMFKLDMCVVMEHDWFILTNFCIIYIQAPKFHFVFWRNWHV
jgi:hypothetical protein